MIVDLDVFTSCVENRIGGKGKSTHIITKKEGRVSKIKVKVFEEAT